MGKRQDSERECKANGIAQRNLFRNMNNNKKTRLKAKDKLAESNGPRKEEIAFVRPLQDNIFFKTNRETE